MTTMRALVYDRYGPPEQVLRLEQVPRPQPQPGEVLVRVKAASVNSWDWDLIIGTPMGRISGPLKPPHKILGADIAGTVEAIGQGVTAFQPGDPVFGDLSEGKWGGFADYVCAPAKTLAKIPDGVSFTDAAALPQAGSLALQALHKFEDLGPGHTVLFNGAGGGVGTLGIQLAKAKGAKIIAVDRAEKREAVLALGADGFIDYRSDDYTAAPESYDLIIDVVANRPAAHYARCLKPGGRFFFVGGTFNSLLRVALSGLFRRDKSLGALVYKVSPTDNLALAELCSAGKLHPIIDSAFPLEDAPKAIRRLGSGLAIGKVVVSLV
ncbi:NAD(P)-dependent alcohol dehydrogenase [Devosia sp.]|uniref:NAD(P)-dependent alcohol dehydrogenase n=1 Tax=Devosia sp. TaxID=1871048 RepID=UPI001B2A92A7|nr:NAD(P)-dependent alcohol dehydrogenase [Devosia sp.]MBO9588087.1 NAD(P)-dependent alcohol dehydrogenase [Devosia sp.]